jgi:hypothetical protein
MHFFMKRLIILTAFLVFVFTVVEQVKAAEQMVFDSTDNYLGACKLTDTSEWKLSEDLTVTKFEVWYSWNQGETVLPVKLFFNGEKFAEFEATRGNCDPYQKQWCNADYQINKLFPKGTYSTEIPNARQCLKPGGTGAIRLFADDNTKKTTEPSITIAPTVTESIHEQVRPNAIATNQQANCSCSQTTILLTAAGTSLATSLLVSLILRRGK